MQELFFGDEAHLTVAALGPITDDLDAVAGQVRVGALAAHLPATFSFAAAVCPLTTSRS